MSFVALEAANAVHSRDREPGAFEYTFAAGFVALAVVVALVSVVLVRKRKAVEKAAADPGDLRPLEWERPTDDRVFRADVGQTRSEPPSKHAD